MEFVEFLNKIKESIRIKYMSLYFENPNLNKTIDKMLEHILIIYSDFGESINVNIDEENNAKELMMLIEELIDNSNNFKHLNAGSREYFITQKGLFDKILVLEKQ